MRAPLPCLVVALALLGSVGCTNKDPKPADKPKPTAPADGGLEMPPTPTPAPTPTTGDDTAGETPAQSGRCDSDLDCIACIEDPCRCRSAPAKATTCPDNEVDCVRDPCVDRSASCWNGECRLRFSDDGPCASDDDCEIREDMNHCDLYAAAKSSPLPERHTEGCATLPSQVGFVARCVTDAKRCVLQRRDEDPDAPPPPPPLSQFELRLSCDLYGTAISNDTITVDTAAGTLQLETTGRKPRQVELTPADLAPLGKLLKSADFARFLSETPAEGPPAPGQRKCTLDVTTGSIKIESKKWTSSDTFGADAKSALDALHSELGTLQRGLPPPELRK